MAKKHLELFYRRHAGELHHANANTVHEESLSLNDKIAVFVSSHIGTMWFCYTIALLMFWWSLLNMAILPALHLRSFDPAPFSLLFFFLGGVFQTLMMPMLMVTQNLGARHSELRAEAEYHTGEASFKELEHQRSLLSKQSTVLLNVQSEVKSIHTQLKLTPPVDKEHCLALIDSIRTDLMPVHRYIHATSLATEQQARLMLVWNALSELALMLGSKREEETLE